MKAWCVRDRGGRLYLSTVTQYKMLTYHYAKDLGRRFYPNRTWRAMYRHGFRVVPVIVEEFHG